jgi:hypothetical protein
MRVDNFVPSLVIVSGLSNGSFSYILSPWTWQGWQLDWSIGLTSEAKVGHSANVWVEVVGLFVVVVDLVNAFGFVPLCFETSDEINVSINMLFGIAACLLPWICPSNADYFGRNTVINLFALEMPPRKSMRSIADNQIRTLELRNSARFVQTGWFAFFPLTRSLAHVWGGITQSRENFKLGSTPVRAANAFYP